MDFHEAERLFRNLDQAYHAGQLTLQTYTDELAKIRVTDANGVLWTQQIHTGQWHFFRDGKWIPDSPYPQDLAHPTQKFQPIPAAPRKTSSLGWIFGVLAGLVLLGVVAAVGIFIFPGVFPQIQGALGLNPQTTAVIDEDIPPSNNVSQQTVCEISRQLSGDPGGLYWYQ